MNFIFNLVSEIYDFHPTFPGENTRNRFPKQGSNITFLHDLIEGFFIRDLLQRRALSGFRLRENDWEKAGTTAKKRERRKKQRGKK
jgi:hypothetical protein